MAVLVPFLRLPSELLPLFRVSFFLCVYVCVFCLFCLFLLHIIFQSLPFSVVSPLKPASFACSFGVFLTFNWFGLLCLSFSSRFDFCKVLFVNHCLLFCCFFGGFPFGLFRLEYCLAVAEVVPPPHPAFSLIPVSVFKSVLLLPLPPRCVLSALLHIAWIVYLVFIFLRA